MIRYVVYDDGSGSPKHYILHSFQDVRHAIVEDPSTGQIKLLAEWPLNGKLKFDPPTEVLMQQLQSTGPGFNTAAKNS